MSRNGRLRAGVGLVLGIFALAGCEAMPRGGPMTAAVTAPAEDGLEGLVVPLTAAVAQAVARPATGGVPPSFRRATPIDPTRLGVDDTLDITVWESQEMGLFGRDGEAGTIQSITVDPSGSIFVPFVGLVPAAGRTVADLRQRLRAALVPLTQSPQVDVRLREPHSRALTVQGAVARPGRYVIDRSAARLTPMLALAGGAILPPEQAEVVVRRGGETAAVMLEDLYSDPSLDIALRPGDIVLINAIRERFVVLGATRVQGEITFPTRRLSLLRAIGAARGLIDFDADPTGVFVFRREARAVADRLLPGAEPAGLPAGSGRPVVYRLDLSQPGALFVAETFDMRDGDAIFVTNAPLTELRKFLQLFTAVLTPVQQGSTLAPP